jgi:hypothetical protein
MRSFMQNRQRARAACLLALAAWEYPCMAQSLANLPEVVEVSLAAGYNNASLIGLSAVGPAFAMGLRPALAVSLRSTDKIDDDGNLEQRSVPEFQLGIATRTLVAENFFWSTGLGLGTHRIYGTRANDTETDTRTENHVFSEFQSGFGLQELGQDYQAGQWIQVVETGFSMRLNFLSRKAFLVEGQDPLPPGSVGAYVRIGLGR